MSPSGEDGLSMAWYCFPNQMRQFFWGGCVVRVLVLFPKPDEPVSVEKMCYTWLGIVSKPDEPVIVGRMCYTWLGIVSKPDEPVLLGRMPGTWLGIVSQSMFAINPPCKHLEC
jgi:hypothetical protein